MLVSSSLKKARSNNTQSIPTSAITTAVFNTSQKLSRFCQLDSQLLFLIGSFLNFNGLAVARNSCHYLNYKMGHNIIWIKWSKKYGLQQRTDSVHSVQVRNIYIQKIIFYVNKFLKPTPPFVSNNCYGCALDIVASHKIQLAPHIATFAQVNLRACVKLLLQAPSFRAENLSKTSLSAYNCGEAIVNAARRGHNRIVMDIHNSHVAPFLEASGLPSAALKGNLPLIFELFKNKIVFHDSAIRTAVLFASEYGHLSVVQEILKYSKPSERQENLGVAVCAAIEKGHFIMAHELLKDGTILPEKQRSWAVRHAALKGQLSLIFLLLKNGPITEGKRGNAICDAAEGGYLDVIRALTQDIAIPQKYLSKAIALATEKGHAPIVKYLTQFL